VKSPSFSLSSWRLWPLLLCHLGVLLLLLSSFLPFWETIDKMTFTWMNNSLRNSSSWQTFWALSNHSIADWVEDLCILGFYAIALFRTPKMERKKRVWQFVFCLFFIALTILLINRLLCRDFLHLRRYSPTLMIEGSFRLSDLLPWLAIKDGSSKSFPGDHATTALLFAGTYAFFAGRVLGFYGFLYSILLCLPRLIVGAHWLSDLIIGSGAILLFAMSWLLFTPLREKGPIWVQKMLEFRRTPH
jgi:Kdo2-lipid A phosphotransferase